MQRTRQQILHYLKTYKSASAHELSGAINVTAANIRHHLGLLQDAGLVQEVGKRGVKGPGRPQLLYGLTSRALEDNMAGLLGAILEGITSRQQSPDAEHDVYREIARTLIKGRGTYGQSAIERLNQAVDILNYLHYHASWEAHPGGPQVILRHCPYQKLADHHPELCHVDKHLLTILTGREMVLEKKRSFTSSPPGPCIFAAGTKGD